VVGFAAAACSQDDADLGTLSLPSITSPSPGISSEDGGDAPGQEDGTVILNIGDDFQALVEDSPEGTSFVIASGVHRLQEIWPKDGMTFEGRPGAVMSGAIVVEDWESEGVDTWRLDGIVPTGFDHGECVEGYEGCRLTQDLFIDDIMLWQVTDVHDLGPGSWYWDGERILIADDPTSRRVELSVATHAFQGAVDDVTIRGVVVEKYAVPAQFGAVQAADPFDGPLGQRWLIEDSEIRLNHGAGVRMGDQTILRRLNIHHNGQLGISGSGGMSGIVEDSEIANNNIAGFRAGWEAGGAKFTETTGLVVRHNTVHDNDGPGLWTDNNNFDTLYESNVVSDNSGPGIFHEISYDAVIRDNTVTGNGSGWAGWLWGSGILVAASSDVEIYGNTVTGNDAGIGGIQQEREDGPEGPHLLSNMFVHDNTISVELGLTGIVEDVGDFAVFTDRENRFESNTYIDTVGRRYTWMGRKLDAVAWQEEGQDLEGTWR
jgi:parallel beta-helix repeat protein